MAGFGGMGGVAAAVVVDGEFDTFAAGIRTTTSAGSPWRVALVRLSWTMR